MNMTTSAERRLVSQAEFCRLANIPHSALIRALKAGRIAPVQSACRGRVRLFDASHLDELKEVIR